MPGTYPVSGTLSMDDLAGTLSSEEQLRLEQLTALTTDSGQARNLATFIAQPSVTLGLLSICTKGASSPGTKILSTNAYVSGAKTDIDVYRLAP